MLSRNMQWGWVRSSVLAEPCPDLNKPLREGRFLSIAQLRYHQPVIHLRSTLIPFIQIISLNIYPASLKNWLSQEGWVKTSSSIFHITEIRQSSCSLFQTQIQGQSTGSMSLHLCGNFILDILLSSLPNDLDWYHPK